MSHQWKSGELAVCVDDSPDLFDGIQRLRKGWIYSVLRFYPSGCEYVQYRPGVVGPNRQDNVSIQGLDPNFRYFSSRFRPLNGTDIRKLEEKYPEYQIKTNEVEG